MKAFKIVTIVLALFLCVMLSCVVYKQVKEHMLQDDPMLRLLREITTQIDPSFADTKLYKGDKSYTINKDKTFLCLYDKNGDYYPINMLIYVLCHEQAHKLNKKDIGHTEEFYRIFNELLEKASAMGVYNPSIPVINDYCE